MKPRQVLVLAVILAALISAVVVKQFTKPKELARDQYTPLDLSFDVSKVSKISVQKGKDEKKVELAKDETGWKVLTFHGARADQGKIAAFLKAVNEAKGELRSRDKSLLGDFGLAEDSAYKIDIQAKDQSLLSFYLGTKRTSFPNVFVRKVNTDTVNLMASDFFTLIGIFDDPEKTALDSNFWVDLKFLDFNLEAVEGLQATRMEGGRQIQTVHVDRKVDPNDQTQKSWSYGSRNMPFALSAEKIKQFLSTSKTLTGLKVLDPTGQDYGFKNPSWTLKLALEGGKEITVLASPPNTDSKTRYVQISTEPVVYELADYTFKNVDIDDSRFFVDNPLEIDPDQVEHLSIHSGSKVVDVDVKSSKNDAVTAYLGTLKSLAVTRLLFNEKEVKKIDAQVKRSLTVNLDKGKTVSIEVGDLISEEIREYAARKKEENQPVFSIAESAYKSLFDDLDRLNKPKSA